MTNKEAAQILRGMIDFDFKKKKNTALSMGWTALRDAEEAKQKIIELADTIDKQNELIKKYQYAIKIAADAYFIHVQCINCSRYKECSSTDNLSDDCYDNILNGWKRKAGIE